MKRRSTSVSLLVLWLFPGIASVQDGVRSVRNFKKLDANHDGRFMRGEVAIKPAFDAMHQNTDDVIPASASGRWQPRNAPTEILTNVLPENRPFAINSRYQPIGYQPIRTAFHEN